MGGGKAACMDEYIERRFVLNKIVELQRNYPHDGTERDKGIYDACAHLGAFVELMTAADVAPVIHARWVSGPTGLRCSNCRTPLNRHTAKEMVLGSNYCPNCGAKMDMEDEHGECDL